MPTLINGMGMGFDDGVFRQLDHDGVKTCLFRIAGEHA